MKIFTVDLTPDEKYYRIILTDEAYERIGYPAKGSYNLLGARICGMDFYDYCRMIRDNFNGILIGKNSVYPIIYFEKANINKTMELVNMLNDLANRK